MREGEEMTRDWGDVGSQSLYFLILSPFLFHFLILSPFPLHFLILSSFPLHFLILFPFPCSPAARLQQVAQPCEKPWLVHFPGARTKCLRTKCQRKGWHFVRTFFGWHFVRPIFWLAFCRDHLNVFWNFAQIMEFHHSDKMPKHF